MKASKNTMNEYLDWRGDLEFTRDKLNEVDCLIFASLSYMNLDKAQYADTSNLLSAPTLKQVYEEIKGEKCFGSMFLPLFNKCAMSDRYKDVKVMGYKSVVDYGEETQFSAVTFVLPSGEIVIAFRGTDDSLVGWQEDVNMAVGMIPAQKYARRYACNIADSIPEKPIYIVGHSKGGNLAVWSAAYLYDIYFERLQRVYDFDGPGFYGDFTCSDEYKRIIDKTTKYVVDASIVGMLLSSKTPQTVVDSVKHSSIMQHLTSTWVVSGTKLSRLRNRSTRGLNSQAVIEELIESLTYEERRKLAEILSRIVQSSNINRFSELKSIETIPKFFEIIIKSTADEEEKQLIQKILRRVVTIIKKQTISRSKLGALVFENKE